MVVTGFAKRVLFMAGRRYWLSPAGEWIDCNRGLGHLRATLEWCKANNVSTDTGDFTKVMYDAGYVRIVVTESQLHITYYKPLTLTQINSLTDHAWNHGLTLYNDVKDCPVESF